MAYWCQPEWFCVQGIGWQRRQLLARSITFFSIHQFFHPTTLQKLLSLSYACLMFEDEHLFWHFAMNWTSAHQSLCNALTLKGTIRAILDNVTRSNSLSSCTYKDLYTWPCATCCMQLDVVLGKLLVEGSFRFWVSLCPAGIIAMHLLLFAASAVKDGYYHGTWILHVSGYWMDSHYACGCPYHIFSPCGLYAHHIEHCLSMEPIWYSSALNMTCFGPQRVFWALKISQKKRLY